MDLTFAQATELAKALAAKPLSDEQHRQFVAKTLSLYRQCGDREEIAMQMVSMGADAKILNEILHAPGSHCSSIPDPGITLPAVIAIGAGAAAAGVLVTWLVMRKR